MSEQKRSACLSDQAIEKAVARDGWAKPMDPEMTRHLQECPDCRARVDEALRLGTLFADEVAPRTLPRLQRTAATLSRTPHARWRFLVLPVAAAAAGVLFVLFFPSAPTEIPPPVADQRPAERAPAYVGTKGAASLTIYCLRDGERQVLADNELLRAGDQVRIRAHAADWSYLLVLHQDHTGTWTVVVPFGDEESVPLRRGEFLAPRALALDAAPGPERLVAVFSARPVAAALVQETMDQAGVQAERIARIGESAVEVVVRRWRKEVP